MRIGWRGKKNDRCKSEENEVSVARAWMTAGRVTGGMGGMRI